MFIQRPLEQPGNKTRKLIHGVGINDANYVVGYQDSSGKAWSCPYYDRWRGMLNRCYSQKTHTRQPSYTTCTVVEPWKTFSNFRAWMETQDWEGKALDKDLLQWGNKQYGPDNCLFVSNAVNSLLALRGNNRGQYPLGVTRILVKEKYEYFEAKCSFYGTQKRLGQFKTVEEAAEAYKMAKLAYIAEVASTETDPRVKQALLALH